MFRHFIISAALAGLVLAAPAGARDWPSAGGWDIAEGATDSCAMGMEYEGKGETLLLLILSTDGRVGMGVYNYGWSSVDDQEYDLVFYLNKTAFSGGKSIGTSSQGRRGFITLFEPDFLQNFAASTYLTIATEDEKMVDDLRLDGSAAGLAQLRRCVAHLKAAADAAARERARFSHIPDDPFAAGPAPQKSLASDPQPRAAPTSFFSSDDYPESARRAHEQGQVSYRLAVGGDGRVRSCEIVSSSGSASLDERTCTVLRTRLRFTPAKKSDGAPIDGIYEGKITWTL